MRYAQFNRHEVQKRVSGSMKSALVFIGIVILLALTNCAGNFSYSAQTTYITEEIRKTFSIEDLKRIQYYVDEDIVLSRELNTGEAPAVSGGAVVIRNGKQVETVRIARSTPGVLVEIKNIEGVECLGICFEESDDDLDKLLLFAYVTEISGQSKPDAGYFLIGDFNRDPLVIQYGDKDYNVAINNVVASVANDAVLSAWPMLKGVIKSTNTEVRQERKAGGRRVQ